MRLAKLLIIGLIVPLSSAWSARILLVFPYDVLSQCSLLTPYMQSLIDRGHELTLIHAFSNCSIIDQVESIYVPDRYNSAIEFNFEIFLQLAKWAEVTYIRNFMIKMCLNVLDAPEVQKLMRSNVTYDLLVMEPSYTDGLFGLAEHFKAKLMGLASSGGDWNINNLVGYYSTSTFEPLLPIGFRRGGTLIDRFQNWVVISEEWLMHRLIFLPALRSVHERYFGHLDKSFKEIRHSYSLMLLNQHFSLFDARPNAPNLIEVGGMHVPKKVPELPQHLAEFIDHAPHGVILMCLGSEIQSSDLPEDILKAITETFESLPQRVIWKFEGRHRPNVSDKIFIDEWLPQQAILAHPNVRLFISNGGMLSIMEAAHYAKPVLGLPLFFDQFRNMERLEHEKAAIIMETMKLTQQDFRKSIKQLLEEPQYRHNIKKVSQRFRDQLAHPLDVAVYWTEYVHRYEGAPHMRISPDSIKLVEYYYVDLFMLVVVRLSLILLVICYALKKIVYFRQGIQHLLYTFLLGMNRNMRS